MKIRFLADADLIAKIDHLTAIEALLLVWVASEAEEWTNHIFTLPL
jgi:hypothetical protein